MSVELKDAKRMMRKFNINPKVIKPREFKKAMEIELEHGSQIPLTNVTGDNLELTAKIALAHIIEYVDYYKRLIRMEKQAEKFWEGKIKPSIFL